VAYVYPWQYRIYADERKAKAINLQFSLIDFKGIALNMKPSVIILLCILTALLTWKDF